MRGRQECESGLKTNVQITNYKKITNDKLPGFYKYEEQIAGAQARN